MDAIYSDGTLNGSSSLPFESDFLTSVPINLDYPGRTDIYLSFFYEPMGLGDIPEVGARFELEKMSFRIVSADKRGVRLVRITVNEENELGTKA